MGPVQSFLPFWLSSLLHFELGEVLRLLRPQSHLLNVQIEILPYVTRGAGAWEASQNTRQE